MSTNDKPLILVADDEPSTLALVSNHLRGRGYRVIEATDGDEAWDLACRELPDLVVLDVMMPGMSGWEVCRKIREAVSLAHTGVVMLTGIGDTLNELTSPLYGADAYLDKPFQFTKLQELVEDTLKTREGGNLGRPEHTAGPATRLWKTSMSGSTDDESKESAPRSRKTKKSESKPLNKAAKPAPEKPASSVKKASPSEKLTLVGAKKKAVEILKQILPAKPPVKAKAKAELKPAVPAKKAPVKKAPIKKAPVKKAPAKKAPVKKAPAKKAPVKKAPAKKAPVKKAPIKKAPVKKAPTKKAPVKKAPVKKAPAKKTPVKKAPPAKKAPAKKTPVKKAPPAKKAAAKKPTAKKASKKR